MEIKRNLLCCQKARILGSDYLYWSRYFSLDVPGKRWLQAVDGDKMHRHGWLFVVGRNACTSKCLLPTPRPGCPKSPRSRTDLGSSAFLFLRFPVSSGFWISALYHLLWSPIFFLFFPPIFLFSPLSYHFAPHWEISRFLHSPKINTMSILLSVVAFWLKLGCQKEVKARHGDDQCVFKYQNSLP